MGLSQAKLGELVGRSTSTIRSWERDTSRPTDPKAISALAAILGVDERQLFEKAGVERPAESDDQTVEQALATLTPIQPVPVQDRPPSAPSEGRPEATTRAKTVPEPSDAPAFVAPAHPYLVTQVTPTVADQSYIEDAGQRQVYRVRNLATLVVVVALVIAFIWAFAEGWEAITDWWDSFFGGLQL